MNDVREAEAFGRHWIDAWNRRDVEAVLALFVDEVLFTSPKALVITGSASVSGKSALRVYWTTALAAIGNLHFVLDAVLWDPVRRTLVIRYRATLNGTSRRAVEIFEVDGSGRVLRGEALYGAEI